MPPKKGKKKKSGKKAKKSGKKSGKESVPLEDLAPKLSVEHKDNFLIQVKDLEKQIAYYQRKCDYLEIINDKFDSEFNQTNENKQDISEHLDILLRIRVDEITKLNSELTKLQELRDQEKAAFEQQIQQKKVEFEETIEQLTSDKRIKSGQLASMEEFKVQKEDLMMKFTELQEEINKLEDFNKEEIYQKERSNVVDMDRLKKETILRVNNVSSEFRKVSNRQMAETNKKTIRENVELSNMIKKRSEKTMELIEENDKLRAIDNENKRQIEISLTVEKELMKKNNINVKNIKYWIEECRNNEMEVSQFESEEHRAHAEFVQSENKSLISDFDSQMEKYQYIEIEKNKLQLEQENIKSDILSSKNTLKIHKRLVNKTKNALIDAENLMDPSEEFTEGEVILRRQAMLSSLLELMNSATVLGFGLQPRELGKQHRSIKL